MSISTSVAIAGGGRTDREPPDKSGVETGWVKRYRTAPTRPDIGMPQQTQKTWRLEMLAVGLGRRPVSDGQIPSEEKKVENRRQGFVRVELHERNIRRGRGRLPLVLRGGGGVGGIRCVCGTLRAERLDRVFGRSGDGACDGLSNVNSSMDVYWTIAV